ncbi:DNA-directed RNA polymerase subunit alpha C-terminal domain-containing protein [Microvirga sp. GCM10011540]|uniref:DNA-directed RNA polymerase subunit alpha C-terminal domain-containing protein n=1 Tax=Microvirga sp. GCM10011540 TaxID=3317338 RepID=UPI003615028C
MLSALRRVILDLPRWKTSQMLEDKPTPGPIDGLRLPQRAWKVLQQENITTLDRLRAVADRIERFDNIGRKTAKVIRAELTRLKFRERPGHYRGHMTRG